MGICDQKNHMGKMMWYDKTIQHQTQAYTQHFSIYFSSSN